MKPFLRDVAETLVHTFNDFKDVVLILPGKRAGIFLKHELLNVNTGTTYAPEFYSIEEFVEKLSGLTAAAHVQLLFEFYEVYKKETAPEDTDSFQHFSRWAQIVLQDFDEIDRHLTDHEQLFGYLSSVKELNHWYVQKEKTTLQENYIRFWNHLKGYYIKFRQRLLAKQLAYPGLLYSQALKKVGKYLEKNPEKHHVFIGFNALSRAEEKLILEFLDRPKNHIFWDIDHTFLSDNEHDAGLFIRSYKKTWNYFKTREFKMISHHFSDEKNIHITGIPRTVGQAKYVGKLIAGIHKKTGHTENTAIVLGNDDLLTPILNALPPETGPVNVTYGAPLYQAPVTSFFGALFHLMENRRTQSWYYKHVLQLLSHSLSGKLLSRNGKDYAAHIIDSIQRENIVYVSRDYLKTLLHEALHETSDLMFTAELRVNTIIEKCIALIYRLKALHDKNDIYLEYLYKFHEIFNRILHLNTTYNAISDIVSLKRIYHELLREETVNFRGEPLRGLQIMGMLESRNLDFENVIITAVNEGILPSGKKQASFLPFDVKLTFNLPTYKEKDAVYTYHFYRLLQRAKNIYLLYNTEPDVLEGGEKSRFLLQLITQQQPRHHVKEIIASPEVSQTSKQPVKIKKSADIITRLKAVAVKGFSPTSLSNYVRNPIDFYHNTILGITTEDTVAETVTAKMLGLLIHGTLEDLYKPLEGKLLAEADISGMKKNMKAAVSKNIAQLYRKDQGVGGKNHIGFSIVERYIEHFLALETVRLRQGKRIKLLYIEKPLETHIHIPELALDVTLKGTIDRVEEVDGVLTIIDYKTGKTVLSDVEIVTEADLIADYKYHKAFQLLSYAYLYTRHQPPETPAEAMVLSFKNLKSGYLKFAKKNSYGSGARNKSAAIDRELLNAYEGSLKTLILEIFNTDVPFTEKAV